MAESRRISGGPIGFLRRPTHPAERLAVLLTMAGLVIINGCTAAPASVDAGELSFPVAVEAAPSDEVGGQVVVDHGDEIAQPEDPVEAPEVVATVVPREAPTAPVERPTATVEAEPLASPPRPTTSAGLGSDRELQLLADRCFSADMVACDSLFVSSPAGSPYEVYGSTCGGRVAVGAACAGEFRSAEFGFVTLLADDVLLRDGPSLDAEPLVAIRGYVGAELPLLERSRDLAWVRTVVLGDEGWFFAGFAVPAPDGFIIARTTDREPADLLDLDSENPSQSFVLAQTSRGEEWRVLIPDGTTATVDGSLFDVLSSPGR